MHEAVLMFSGGLDTTWTAVELLKRFDRLHLLTFCNGACVRLHASKTHVDLLKGMFGADRIVHRAIGVADIFRFVRRGLVRDMLRYRSPLLFDICCRLSMETAATVYCLAKGIAHIADGNNPDTQGVMFLQMERYLAASVRFYEGYGLAYARPEVRLSSRREIAEALRDAGIATGSRTLEKLGVSSQLFTQPFCLWAPVTFFFTSPFRHNPVSRLLCLPVDRALAARAEREERAHALVQSYRMYDHAVRHDYPACRKKLPTVFGFLGPELPGCGADGCR